MTVKLATRRPAELDAPAPGVWALDTSHTTVSFIARHLMVSKVRGRFAVFSGTIHVADAIEESAVEVTVEANSIDSGDAQRDAHLRSPDFLDAENHPEISFRSTKVERVGDTRLAVTGDLTVRGVTRPVVLDVDYIGTTLDPWGNTRTAFTATTEIDREDFGLTWNVALETGGVLVGRKVRIELEVQAIAGAGEQAA